MDMKTPNATYVTQPRNRKQVMIEQLDDGKLILEFYGHHNRKIVCTDTRTVAHELRLFFGDGVESIGV